MSYDLKVFTENIEPEAVNQIYELIRTTPLRIQRYRLCLCPLYRRGFWGS